MHEKEDIIKSWKYENNKIENNCLCINLKCEDIWNHYIVDKITYYGKF